MTGGFAGAVHADTAMIGATKDNTLYEDVAGAISNGAGVHLFAGRTSFLNNKLRRAVIAFDIAGNIPAGSTINSVELRLNMSKTISGNVDINMHRLGADWGQGASNAPGEEGAGAASASGDATWIHTFFNTSMWATAGGDFFSAPSAITAVGGVGVYTWGSTAQLVSDAQEMLDSPAMNFGWILLGGEGVLGTAKRFDSRENATAANRPQLIIDYTPPAGCPADLTNNSGGGPDGSVDVFDLFVLLANWNLNGPGADLAAPNDIVDVFDLFVMLDAWGDC